MLEPSSLEMGLELIESYFLDHIEDRLELMVQDRAFHVRVSMAEIFIRGPRTCPGKCVERGTDSESSNSENGVGLVDNEEVKWRGNQLWDVGLGYTFSGAVDRECVRVETSLGDLGSSHREVLDGPIRAIDPGCNEPSLGNKRSKVEVVTYEGTRQKLRPLDEVIQSLLSLEEHIEAVQQQQKKGRERLRKAEVTSSAIANISLSNLDFVQLRETILKEANSMVCLGKLIGVKTVGNEDNIFSGYCLDHRTQLVIIGRCVCCLEMCGVGIFNEVQGHFGFVEASMD
ncbi:hypothetical protein V6N13_037535 [Hibiscus sabdariffa]|uniref:Uncharacterized protein n=1 Tax=Hibiscus sabdariffa TaxID=183260 RepID=A0ABR2S4T0_9ROSI